jgi:tetratricopeptide (TPR) repeat protein
LVFLLGTCSVVLPFTIRNLVVSDEFVLLSANGGINLWIGNHLGASGFYETPPDFDVVRDPLGLTVVEEAARHRVGYAEASRWWSARTLDDIEADPLAWLRLLLRKAILFIGPKELPQLGATFEWSRSHSLLLKVPLNAYLVLIAALLAPAVHSLQCGRAALSSLRWPLIALVSYALVISLFFITGRYRLPIMPTAVALAAITCTTAWDRLRQNRHKWALAVVVLAVIVGGGHVLYGRGGPFHTAAETGDERRIGLLLLNQGRPEEAINLLEQALRIRDDPVTRVALARALRTVGRTEDAIIQFERALQADPRNANTLYNYGNLLWIEKQDLKQAETLYREAIFISPRFGEAYHNLGAVLLEQDRFEEAAEMFETALQLAPSNAHWREAATKGLLVARQALAVNER